MIFFAYTKINRISPVECTTNSIFLCTFGKTDLLHRGFSPVNRDIKSKRALAIKKIKCY